MLFTLQLFSWWQRTTLPAILWFPAVDYINVLLNAAKGHWKHVQYQHSWILKKIFLELPLNAKLTVPMVSRHTHVRVSMSRPSLTTDFYNTRRLALGGLADN